MKRRSFLVRALVMPLSAAVFSASGWLMGTRSLTMAPPEAPTPPPGSMGQTYVTCSCHDEPDPPCTSRWECRNGVGYWDHWYGCMIWPCSYGWCRWIGHGTQITC